MAKRCIFCGKEFGLFGGGLITCGDTDQPVYSNCSGNLSQLSPTERAERALATGRALHPDELQKFLVWDRKHKEQERTRQEQARQAIRTDKTCLRCGGPMERYGDKRFHLHPTVQDILSPVWLEVEVIRCARCGKAEFYIPQPPDLPEIKDNPPRPEAADQEEPFSRPDTSRHGGKPPWEK